MDSAKEINNTRELEIANRNDVFRKLGFGVTMTIGASTLHDISGLMQSIRAYNEFSEDNDPYHEHDFGSLVWNGQKVFWKIDYYNETLTEGRDPLDPDCKRVMTVMLASEY